MWDHHQVSDERGVFLEWFRADVVNRTIGHSARVIGYSHTATAVLVVILVHRETGRWWGANGWRANSTDARIYRERTPT